VVVEEVEMVVVVVVVVRVVVVGGGSTSRALGNARVLCAPPESKSCLTNSLCATRV